MKALVSKLNTYEAIKRLGLANGVSIGNWEYHLDGEVETGYFYLTEDLLKRSEFIPVVRVYCSDGWLDATNYKNVLKDLI